jgi:hypothetical protein
MKCCESWCFTGKWVGLLPIEVQQDPARPRDSHDWKVGSYKRAPGSGPNVYFIPAAVILNEYGQRAFIRTLLNESHCITDPLTLSLSSFYTLHHSIIITSCVAISAGTFKVAALAFSQLADIPSFVLHCHGQTSANRTKPGPSFRR